MLRPLENAPPIQAGSDDEIVRMRGCPDCYGRGWFLKHPFAMYNQEYVQCPTCLSAKQHFDKYGTLPRDIAMAMTHNV